MTGRAITDQQKWDILMRIGHAWLKNPHQRLGQLMNNAIRDLPAPMFAIEDEDLASALESWKGNIEASGGNK